MRILCYFLSLVLVVSGSCGCAATMASMDADAAMKVAADANMTNIKTLVQGRMSEHHAALARLDAEMPKVLAKVKTGAEAVTRWAQYTTNKVRLERARDVEGLRLQGALNTAAVLQATAIRRIGISNAWNTWLGRFPALSQLKTLAEGEVRNYMHDLRTGVKINDGN
jgi:hypothetical protein